MRPVPRLDISPAATVEFNPGKMHLILIGLRKPIVLGQRFPMTLTFAEGTIGIEVYVQGMGAEGMQGSMHDGTP